MPLPGKVEPLTGLRRGLLYDLARNGTIRTVLLRRPGAIRGVRLIDTRSLLGYLHGLCDAQNGGGRNSTFVPNEETKEGP